MNIMTEKNKHYDKVKSIIQEYATDPDFEGHRLGIKDNNGWYKYNGAERERFWHLADDYPQLMTARTIYNTLQFFNIPLEQKGEYKDIIAMTLFLDCDLKETPEERSEELKEVAEKTIKFVYNAYTKLVSPKSIELYDSGGGFYCEINHRVTYFIGQIDLPAEDKGLIWKELCQRFDKVFLKSIEKQAKEKIEGYDDYFKFDYLNNNNRQVKTPLSVHKKLPYYVHPIDPENIDFDPEKIPITDTKLLEHSKVINEKPDWETARRDFENLISILWQEYEGNAEERLKQWIKDKKEEERRRVEQRRAEIERLKEKYREIENLEQTTNVQDIFDAINSISMYELVELLFKTTHRSDGSIRFEPTWRVSESGTSCFICNDHSVHDLKEKATMNVIQLIAAHLGLVSPGDTPRGKDFWRCVDELRSLGFKIPELKLPEKRRINYNKKSTEEVGYTTIESEPPGKLEKKCTLVEHKPRRGNTHYAVSVMVEAGSGNFITHRQAINRHAIEILKNLKKPHETAVHLEGKNRVCNEDGNCKSCLKYPNEKGEGIGFFEQHDKSKRLIDKHKVLTADLVPPDLCPYYTVKFADEYADYCFTVPFYLTNDDLKMRRLTVLDEDPTIDFLYASSAELADFTFTSKTTLVKNHLEKEVSSIEYVEDTINQKDRKQQYDKDILKLISKLKEINKLLQEIQSYPTKKQQVTAKLEGAEFPEVQSDSLEVIEKIKEYERPLKKEESISSFFEPLLYPYEKRFIWSGDNPSTIFMVGKRELINTFDFNRLLVIGRTRAKLLVDDMVGTESFSLGKDEVVIYRPKPSGFTKNFCFFVVEDEDRKREDHRLLKLIKILNQIGKETRLPILVLTSSKRQQESLANSLGGIAHMAREEADQEWNHRGGYTNIFYQNSVMSRGLNVDFYDMVAVYSCSFAQPYWQARYEFDKEVGDEEDAEYVKEVLSSILTDETTNSVFRISPVKGRDERQLKGVIIGSRDLHNIHQEMMRDAKIIRVGEDVNLNSVADAISDLVRKVKKPYNNPADQGDSSSIPSYNKDGIANQGEVFGGLTIDSLGKIDKSIFASGTDANLDEQLLAEVESEVVNHPNLKKRRRVSKNSMLKYLFKRFGRRIKKPKLEKHLHALVERGVILIDIHDMISLRGDQSDLGTVQPHRTVIGEYADSSLLLLLNSRYQLVGVVS